MSLGGLIVALQRQAPSIVQATPLVAHPTNRAESCTAMFGRSKIEHRSPFPADDSQTLPRCPRPAVWCSAKTTRPSEAPPFAIERDRLPHFRRLHVVEQDDVDAVHLHQRAD